MAAADLIRINPALLAHSSKRSTLVRIQFAWRAELDDAPLVHHDNTVVADDSPQSVYAKV
jgi:hypothetical protein